MNDQFVRKSQENLNQYTLSKDYVASNAQQEELFTDVILSELESIDSTKILTNRLQNEQIGNENPLTSNSSFSPPSSKESSEIGKGIQN